MPPRKETITQRKNRATKAAAAKKEAKARGEVILPKFIDPETKVAQMLRGELKVEDMDWEELLRGRFRDKNGEWRGGTGAMVPRKYHEAVSREILLRADSMFRENFDIAMKAMVQLVTEPRTPARERFAAAQFLIERTVGKLTDKSVVEVKVSKFQELVEGGALLIDLEEVDTPALPPGSIVDAVIVEEDL